MRRKLAIAIVITAAVFAFRHFYGFHDGQARCYVARLHPEWSIVDMAVGEGDGDSAYMYIHYRLPGSPALHTAEWQYLWENGRWVLRWRSEAPDRA